MKGAEIIGARRIAFTNGSVRHALIYIEAGMPIPLKAQIAYA
jgi:hypothetical protein